MKDKADAFVSIMCFVSCKLAECFYRILLRLLL